MKRKEFNIQAIKEYGAYYPGVFIIKIAKVLREEQYYDDFDNEDWQNFVHEYTHFLQDISTAHGYLYYQFKAKLLKIAVHYIKNSISKDIILPIKLESAGITNAAGIEMLLDFYNGDYEYLHFHHINSIKCVVDKVIEDLITEVSDFPGKLETVYIYYDDRSAPYQFGNECVIESMTYLLEHHLFGAKKRNNEFPYNTCELVCEQICPALLNKPERIVELAEASLMYPDSGMKFYRFIERCAQYNLEELSDNDFKDFCIGFSKTGFEQLDIAFKTACNGVDVLFPKEFCGTQMTNDQIKVFLECGHNYRQSNKLFISDAFESKDPKEYFKMLIELFDIPMLIDENKNYYGKPGTQLMPVPDAFLAILTEQQCGGCSLQDFCKESGLDCFDSIICTEHPWEQCYSESICPIAAYFIGFGISDRNFHWK